ncbi:MAG: recombinase RecX [Coxiellaceae bacterium]|nr:recombinase RecX [Coxiellaceae bacterium]|tara:strand:- start:689 stop:1141 length:453 start_codon:yes stop_codon:yes gene_type:complete
MMSIREHAMNFLANRDHSQHELRCKLARHDYESDAIDQALQVLAEEGLQCDARFADSYVSSKSQAGYGPRYIIQQLQQRQVSSDLITQAIRMVESWDSIIARVWSKKYTASMQSVKEQAQQRRFLLSRGFDAEQVHQWMKYGIQTVLEQE